MPPQISEEEIRKIVRDTAAELGIEGGRENMGKLMGRVMQNVKGTADGGDVRKIVQEFLA
ncbi:MAG: GatB/YqeY domain-containing protein, partial [Eubacteriales bacterium]|nr:GatB/YqeY domain-containing protein [Eubacteriales bacterium]